MTGRLKLAAAAVVGAALCLFALSRTWPSDHTSLSPVTLLHTIKPEVGLDSDAVEDGACPGVHVADYGRRHAAFVHGDPAFVHGDAAFVHGDASLGGPAEALNGSLVFVARVGGLGNRLRAWATAFYLAVLLDRAFFVHWPAPAGGVSAVGTYWEPTGWFDWRADAAPEPLRQALLAATPHEWRHRAAGPKWDAHAHFTATDFAQTLARPHEAVTRHLGDGTRFASARPIELEGEEVS